MVEAVEDETIIAVIHGSRANRAGSFRTPNMPGEVAGRARLAANRKWGIGMPRGRSTFTKRQKEHTRQQRQKDKAERRNQRRQEKPVEGSVDEMAELRELAAARRRYLTLVWRETEMAEESPGDLSKSRVGGWNGRSSIARG